MSELRNLQGRVQIIRALIYATEHASEVLSFCLSVSADHAVTARELADFCGVSEFQAEVILDMPVRRFSAHAVSNMRGELQAVEDQIRALEI